jgi:hypothetical protein
MEVTNDNYNNLYPEMIKALDKAHFIGSKLILQRLNYLNSC